MNEIHGFTTVVWDDFRMPEWFWKGITRTEDFDCWLVDMKSPQMIVARRIGGVNRDSVMAVVPTCGRLKCANPAHICITLQRK